ncbi:hypothetical protein Tco_1256611 [Tanacetum coccineum]
MSNQSDDIHAAGFDTQFADNTQHDTSLSPANALLENLTKQNGRVVVQNVQGRQNRVQGNNARGVVATRNGGAQYRAGNQNVGQGKPIKCYNCNGISHDNAVDKDVDEPPVQDLALNVDNVFQADDYDAFDSDVDEARTAQTMFMANLSSADPIYDEASQSYDSDILSEVPDHDNYQDAICDIMKYRMLLQLETLLAVVILQQFLSNVSMTTQNNVIDKSLTAELARYKEQVELYERRAKFKLTEREQKIDEQLRIVMTDRNIKEETLKRELHSVKLQLNSTINHNKSVIKSKALKEQTKDSTPITTLTVYPPNTPAKLVPKVLPTKSQVQVNIYSLVQLFLEFDKTCKKRITPTGLTEGERGFEQTKACYLTEVIPFFKIIKEHFEGIQKALINEIKEMKEVFDQMEAEVDQNAVDKKCDEIERKNLLIENENLIVECLSKDVFYTATESVLTVSRFSDMHDAFTAAHKRIAELEAENSNLTHKIQNDDHDEMIKHFSKLEVEHLNLQLKYQHLKEHFRNKKLMTSSDAPQFESVFVIENLKEQLQGRGKTIRELKEKISRLQKKHSEADPILDFKALDS